MTDDGQEPARGREYWIRSVRGGLRLGWFMWIAISLILWAEGGSRSTVGVLLVGAAAQYILALYLSTRLPRPARKVGNNSPGPGPPRPVTPTERFAARLGPWVAAVMLFSSSVTLISGQVARGTPLMIISLGLVAAAVHARRIVQNSEPG